MTDAPRIQDIERSDVSREEWRRIVDIISAEVQSSPKIIDIVPIIVRTMPDVDPQYPEPAKVIRPTFERKRGVA